MSFGSDAAIGYVPILSLTMKFLVDSDEYKCWHEVGHATVCLHLGGDVECIEFLDGDALRPARARCVVLPENEKQVACGGFAAEFYLLNKGYAELPADGRGSSEILFHNSWLDREAFCGQSLGPEVDRKEQTAFMHHAIGSDGYGGVVPFIEQYFSRMQSVVRELHQARRIEGRRVKELLGIEYR